MSKSILLLAVLLTGCAHHSVCAPSLQSEAICNGAVICCTKNASREECNAMGRRYVQQNCGGMQG